MVPYAEFIDFIAAGVTPQQIIDFKPSPRIQQRLNELLYRSKTGILSIEEKTELNEFEQIEHIVRLAKAKAKQHIKAG